MKSGTHSVFWVRFLPLNRFYAILLKINAFLSVRKQTYSKVMFRLRKIIHNLIIKLLINFQVYLVGHVAPGWDERQKGLFQPAHGAYSDYHNRKYIDLVRNYSGIIVGQFFGHLHSDSFRVMYDKIGKTSLSSESFFFFSWRISIRSFLLKVHAVFVF